MTNILYTATNVADAVEALVVESKVPGFAFNVVLHDLEADEFVPLAFLFKADEFGAAMTKANEVNDGPI